jgi:hypothetical protein
VIWDGDLAPEQWRLEVTDEAKKILYVILFNSERGPLVGLPASPYSPDHRMTAPVKLRRAQ